jgi:hypothetical protein
LNEKWLTKALSVAAAECPLANAPVSARRRKTQSLNENNNHSTRIIKGYRCCFKEQPMFPDVVLPLIVLYCHSAPPELHRRNTFVLMNSPRAIFQALGKIFSLIRFFQPRCAFGSS